MANDETRILPLRDIFLFSSTKTTRTREIITVERVSYLQGTKIRSQTSEVFRTEKDKKQKLLTYKAKVKYFVQCLFKMKNSGQNGVTSITDKYDGIQKAEIRHQGP